MSELHFCKGYKDNDILRTNFNSLATSTFGITFENWYEHGYWTDKYEPFSFRKGDDIIANVSVNKLNLLINGERKSALQIGTVMTHPNYRNQGLSAALMNKVIEEYDDEIDIMYLFANQSVLNYYPKFGFKAYEEHQYSIDFTPSIGEKKKFRKLDGTNQTDLQFIYQFAKDRLPVSRQFGTEYTQELLMFYCLYVFTNDIYYLEEKDVIVLFQQAGEELHLFDMISKKENNMSEVIQQIANEDTNKVVFHFNPELNGIQVEKTLFKGSEVLFIRSKNELSLPSTFKHPLTSQA